jgi:hypothetical protein
VNLFYYDFILFQSISIPNPYSANALVSVSIVLPIELNLGFSGIICPSYLMDVLVELMPFLD